MKENKLLKVLGVHTHALTHVEGLMSGLGGFIGIASIYYICNIYIYNEMTALFIIASMGSSAVLLFAAPFSSLAQPWNVLCAMHPPTCRCYYIVCSYRWTNRTPTRLSAACYTNIN